MEAGHTDFSKLIFERIDELFANEIGPVAVFLCEEIFTDWVDEMQKNGNRISLKTIPEYIDKLAEQIDDPANKLEFINAAFEIDAIKYYKNSQQ